MRQSSTHLFMFTEHLPCARTYGLCENCNNKPGKFYPCSFGIERRMCLCLLCALRKPRALRAVAPAAGKGGRGGGEAQAVPGSSFSQKLQSVALSPFYPLTNQQKLSVASKILMLNQFKNHSSVGLTALSSIPFPVFLIFHLFAQ